MKDRYQEMQTFAVPNEKGYMALPLQGGDWAMLYAEDDKTFNETGWKFHLSVAREDVPRAWNIVAEELMNDPAFNNHRAKVAQPVLADRAAKPGYHNPGKPIVVYTDTSVPPEHYQQLLERIERKLRTARVHPGEVTIGDRKVPGSSFIFYRNDQSLAGKYNAAADNLNITMERQYNPDRKEDPYKNFAISEAPPAISLQTAAFWRWQDAKADDGTPFTRVQVTDEANARGVIKTLQDLGMNAIMHKSESLGLTVRVWGEDMERIQKTCEVANMQWQEAVAGNEPITRTPVANSAQAQEVIKTLEYLGIKGHEVKSEQFGLTVRVLGEDMKWIQEAQRELRLTRVFPAPPAPASASSPTLLLPIQPPPPSGPPKRPRKHGFLRR